MRPGRIRGDEAVGCLPFDHRRERRKFKRYTFQAGEGPCVVNGPVNGCLGRVVDISLGGLAYVYVHQGMEWSNEGVDLSRLLNCSLSEAERVTMETVSDRLVEKDFSRPGLTLRRRGVRFGRIPPRTEEALVAYIEDTFQS